MAAPSEAATIASISARSQGAPRTFWRDMVRSFRHNLAAMAGLVIVVLFLIVAVWGAVAAPADTNRSRLGQRLNPPSSAHIMGTDGFGRDIRNRVLKGAPLALLVGVVSVAGGGLIGCGLGLVAGYYRGKIGTVIMRVTDAMLAFPTLLLALAIMATLGPGLTNIMIAVGFSTLPRFTRMMEAEVLGISEREYVTAARSVGASGRSIILQHILPNAISSVLVMATLYVSTAILSEATLSFLGLGPRPPTPTWGAMINDGSSVLQSAPWVVLFPGLAITLAVLGFSLVGDGLRDALDIRLRER